MSAHYTCDAELRERHEAVPGKPEVLHSCDQHLANVAVAIEQPCDPTPSGSGHSLTVRRLS